MTFLSSLSKSHLLFTSALALGMMAPATHAFAQHSTLLVEAPFAFQVGHHSFPAGAYTIQTKGEHMVMVQGKTGNQIGFSMTLEENCAEAPGKAKLVFHKYGNQYFLSDIWLANSTAGRQLVMDRAEKQLRGTLAKRPAPENQIALNVSQP